jgi:hypothetical protein
MWMPEGLIGLGKNAWRRRGLQWRPSSLTRRVLTKTGEEAVELPRSMSRRRAT